MRIALVSEGLAGPRWSSFFGSAHHRLPQAREQISRFLDARGELLDRVHADLVRGLKRPVSGRAGLTAEQVLSASVRQRAKN